MTENKITYTEQMRENPYILSTWILGILCLFLMIKEFIF